MADGLFGGIFEGLFGDGGASEQRDAINQAAAANAASSADYIKYLREAMAQGGKFGMLGMEMQRQMLNQALQEQAAGRTDSLNALRSQLGLQMGGNLASQQTNLQTQLGLLAGQQAENMPAQTARTAALQALPYYMQAIGLPAYAQPTSVTQANPLALQTDMTGDLLKTMERLGPTLQSLLPAATATNQSQIPGFAEMLNDPGFKDLMTQLGLGGTPAAQPGADGAAGGATGVPGAAGTGGGQSYWNGTYWQDWQGRPTQPPTGYNPDGTPAAAPAGGGATTLPQGAWLNTWNPGNPGVQVWMDANGNAIQGPDGRPLTSASNVVPYGTAPAASVSPSSVRSPLAPAPTPAAQATTAASVSPSSIKTPPNTGAYNPMTLSQVTTQTPLTPANLPATADWMKASPMYQIQLSEQQNALNNQLSARGRADSSIGLSTLGRAQERLAATEYENQLNRLSSLINVGLGGGMSQIGSQAPQTQSSTQGMPDLSNLYNQSAAARSGIYSQGASGLGNAASQYGQNLAQGTANIGAAQMQGAQNYSNMMMQSAAIPSGNNFMGTLGAIAGLGGQSGFGWWGV